MEENFTARNEGKVNESLNSGMLMLNLSRCLYRLVAKAGHYALWALPFVHAFLVQPGK